MSIWPAEATDSSAYPFNPQETARLSVYRAAVAAGFYTDRLPSLRGKPEANAAGRLERRSRNAA